MLNDKEIIILDAIKDYIEINGFSPSIRELSRLVGLSSSSTIHRYLVKLESKGFITKIGNSPRTIKVLKGL